MPFATQILLGFLVKSIASFDDTLTRIPILSEMTQTPKGKVVFSIGTILALTAILIIAIFFSFLFDLIPFRRPVLAVLIAFLGLVVYFELLVPKEEPKLKQNISQLGSVTSTHLFRLLVAGFVISFITLLDDALVLVPLFIGDGRNKLITSIGVYIAAFLQIFLVIFFSRTIEKIKYKKELATASLLVLAFLVLVGVV
ncbi:hypothetical protein A3D01_02885 [Candidatus Woesebacteria bacterium RIFCSPHIGHO2_02_FULL_39_13]|uniref:GDT1 family protein n=1 Tax=Candidatus Woesebacteria bacterium RIFCSPHIGHO2_02_FULL_39_13 TaxID=1802505 RepID=A0A1F7YXJ4_9BACT|nr:MAG: hypothetical protein A3D01_02885 [Candidatus Woesebacteria bacterium RIFCSPHIGHO2_02_FULL_39_13]OGM36886.1 MAG: hypothetical protein A3E13_01825 [Candidatus Woesebacteria bacterium RIFCSPHIGHO2_12_FULL_40_20]OGM74790.1 MAG: hypothetical protein A3H19_02310 [Candidatus Woesebacteria bacterium RIFCSPLOWO2_12_FULL_39_9]